MTRAKNDRVDAELLLEYLTRMDFKAWSPPRDALVRLRTVSRRIGSLTASKTAEENRLHAAQATQETPAVVLEDIQDALNHIEERKVKLTGAALSIVREDEELHAQYKALTSVSGIAACSAIKLLAELSVLPEDMNVREVVAHAGLDPRPFQSGSSVNRRSRISKRGNARIREALFFPALTASRCEPVVKAHYDVLLARGKPKKLALTAVMRKLLHSTWAMMKTKKHFSPSKYSPRLARTLADQEIPSQTA